MKPTRLSVNLNKLCLLRNARGGDQPNVAEFAMMTLDAGADGLTLHPRPDARHATANDVRLFAELLTDYRSQNPDRQVELNVEGNPFAATRAGYPGLLDIVRTSQPDQVTFVPDADGQLTSDHGFDPSKDIDTLHNIISAYKPYCGRISVFVDAGHDSLDAFVQIGVDRIELYTGPFAQAHQQKTEQPDVWRKAMSACQQTTQAARIAGLGINAGHDLDQHNLSDLRTYVGGIDEVSIGHALTVEALKNGWHHTIASYVALCCA